MLRLILSSSALTAILSGCSAASATTIDAGNDFHCLGLALAFHGVAQTNDAPEDQQRATGATVDWYLAKSDGYVRAQGKEATASEMSALAKMMDADFQSAKTAMAGCAERAAADAGFRQFYARYRS